jgi:hypothetical protein
MGFAGETTPLSCYLFVNILRLTTGLRQCFLEVVTPPICTLFVDSPLYLGCCFRVKVKQYLREIGVK